ncbi:MAG: AbrB/MazE/SpoVT family DNA-binding domain-containing protein [Thermoleophilia bacterium]|nr:AbrB/MazE/SpoVT family DNA-binding domain-containing protein [Thermoleophilia bacterium]
MSIKHGRHSRHGGAGAPHGHGRFFGTTTVGERGQIVIPKEARDLFAIAPGDKLLVLGDQERGGLALVKADLMEAFIARFLGGAAADQGADEGTEEGAEEGAEEGTGRAAGGGGDGAPGAGGEEDEADAG